MTETFIHDEDLDLNDFTPAMRQFIEVKRRYPETLVLFRMGDFYETFFDDAAKANRLIGITRSAESSRTAIRFRWPAFRWSRSTSTSPAS